MKGALLACLLALPVAAQAPDAPVVTPTVVKLTQGQPAPFDGVLSTDAQAIAVAQAVQDGQGKVTLAVVLVTAGLCLAAGVAAGVAIDRATR